MEKGKGLNTEFQCMDCKKSFKIDTGNVKQIEVESNGNKLIITYVDCQFCGRRHYVQIDNDESSKLKVRNLVMFKKLSKKKLSGKRISKLENNSFKSMAQALLDLRTNLMKEYEGQTVTDTLTGEPVTIHFTFC